MTTEHRVSQLEEAIKELSGSIKKIELHMASIDVTIKGDAAANAKELANLRRDLDMVRADLYHPKTGAFVELDRLKSVARVAKWLGAAVVGLVVESLWKLIHHGSN